MTTIDWLVVAGYLGVLVGITVWVVRQNRDTADDYFLAGRNLGWFVVGASIFASNIGSEHLVGLAGSGATVRGPRRLPQQLEQRRCPRLGGRDRLDSRGLSVL